MTATRPTLRLGARCFFGGARAVLGTPSRWPLAAVPMAVALALFAACAGAGVWASWVLVRGRADVNSLSGAWLGTLALAALVALAVVVGGVVALALAQPLSGWALERLCVQTVPELTRGGAPAESWVAQAWRSLRTALAGLALGLPALGLLVVVDVVAPVAMPVTVPLKLFVVALLVAWDLLDYPLGLRGLGVRPRLRWMRRNFRAVLGFGACAGVLGAVPVLGLVALPFGVVGAARLVAALDAT